MTTPAISYAVRITSLLDTASIQALTGVPAKRILEARNSRRDSHWHFHDVSAPLHYSADEQHDWALDLCRELDGKVINIVPATTNHLAKMRREWGRT